MLAGNSSSRASSYSRPAKWAGICLGSPETIRARKPDRMDEIYTALSQYELFFLIGTSGSVYPATGFVVEALRVSAQAVELNLEPSEGASLFCKSRL